jgi:hypothetical protein
VFHERLDFILQENLGCAGDNEVIRIELENIFAGELSVSSMV